MNSENNYDIAKVKAAKFFLAEDQQQMINKFALKHDSDYLYAVFLYKLYRINRIDGNVTVKNGNDWLECSYNEVLSLYDLLGHSKQKPKISGEWCTVNSLPGVPPNGGLGDSFFKGYVKTIADNENRFIAACEKMGGKRISMGDIGFVFKIFDDLSLLMRFYRADDEFNAQITVLWDKNTLDYIYYETTYYIVGILYELIKQALCI